MQVLIWLQNKHGIINLAEGSTLEIMRDLIIEMMAMFKMSFFYGSKKQRAAYDKAFTYISDYVSNNIILVVVLNE